MYTFSTMENTPLEAIRQAVEEAFADYQVRLDFSPHVFHYTLQRRGYVPELSCGAFADGRLVGFILNGLRLWEGKTTAYDVMTGVIPAHRKQGLTGRMFARAMEVLRAEQYLLEVLKENTAAFGIYKNQGFKVRRELSCYRLDKAKYQAKAPGHHIEFAETFAPVEAFWDFHPSWQNSTDSLNAVPGAFVYALACSGEDIIGYGVIDKKTGDIPQLAVHKNYRRQGVGASVMQALLNSTEADKLSMMNVDGADAGLELFLTGLGFEYLVGQYEMVLDI